MRLNPVEPGDDDVDTFIDDLEDTKKMIIILLHLLLRREWFDVGVSGWWLVRIPFPGRVVEAFAISLRWKVVEWIPVR